MTEVHNTKIKGAPGQSDSSGILRASCNPSCESAKEGKALACTSDAPPPPRNAPLALKHHPFYLLYNRLSDLSLVLLASGRDESFYHLG